MKLRRSTIALLILLASALPVCAEANRAFERSTLPNERSSVSSATTLTEPKSAADFLQRGVAKAGTNDWEGAIAAFNQAIQLKRDYAAVYYNRGTAYARTGNARAALADYSQVILLKPNNAAARYTRGSLRAKVGDRQGALDDFQQAAALFKQEGNRIFYQKAQDYIKQLQPS